MPISEGEFKAMQIRVERTKRTYVNPESEGVELELPLHDEILEACKQKLWGVIHSRTDKKSTTGVGVCDFVIAADGGRTFYIECKSKTGKLRPEQLAFKVLIEMNGHTLHIVRSIEDFWEVVNGNQLEKCG